MNFMKKMSRFLIIMLGVLLVLGGCGKGKEENDKKISGSKIDAVSDTPQLMAYKEKRYLPEFTDTSAQYGAYTTISLGFAEDTFYLIEGKRENYSYYLSECSLKAFHPDTAEEKELLKEADANATMLAGTPVKDGAAIVLLKNNGSDVGYRLYKIDSEGNTIFDKAYPDTLLTQESRNVSLAADFQGRTCLLANNEIILFDEQGDTLGKIDLSGKSIGKVAGSNGGKIYAYERFTGQLMPVEFETVSLGAVSFSVPVNIQPLLGTTSEGDFLICDNTTVYRYYCEGNSLVPLFDFQDSQITDVSAVSAMGEMKDGRIFLFLADGIQEVTEIALLTPTPIADCPVKEVVTIGAVYPSRDLIENVAAFNRENEDFSVSIINYRIGGRTLSEARQALKLDISIGKAPDICILDYLDDTDVLLSGGFFADLSDCLKSSQQYEKEDFVEAALNAYIWQDQLLAIPKYFTLQTIVGKTDIVGSSMGWNMKDVKAVIQNHPDAAMVFDTSPSLYMLDVCTRNLLEQFVDVSKNKSKFDSSEYIELLNFVKDLPDNFNETECWIYGNEWLQQEQALLSIREIGGFNDLQEIEAAFGGKYTCIGYPSSDRSPDCVMAGHDVYAISSNASDMDKAWRFVEWSNSTQGEENYDLVFRLGFPTRTEVFERELKKAQEEEPMTAFSLGGGMIRHSCISSEETEVLYALIESARPERGMERTILEIMEEEVAYLLDGSKTAKDVAAVIQNRVQLYLDER